MSEARQPGEGINPDDQKAIGEYIERWPEARDTAMQVLMLAKHAAAGDLELAIEVADEEMAEITAAVEQGAA